MSTRRERLERKLERREEWAAKAAGRSSAAWEQAHKLGEMIPFGQPILVGHHSEKRHRKHIDKIDRAGQRGLEEYRKAEHHSSKADGLAHQLDRSVFSDDDDAIEQLEARIAEREEERDRMKAANAAWKKAGKPAPNAGAEAWRPVADKVGADFTLRAVQSLVHQGRSDGGTWVPFSWAKPFDLTNIGARIRTDRERIEEIQRRQARTARAEAAGGVAVERCGDAGEWCTVTFAEKPERAVLDALRAAGFRWGAGRWGGRSAALPAEVQALAPVAAPALRYVVKCDDCKQEMRQTDDLHESAAGGRCDDCRQAAGMVPRLAATAALLLALALPAIASAAPQHCYPKGAPEVSECIGTKGIEACGVYVNVNTATADELALLYRVGHVLAQRIIDGRPYASPADVDAVKGIGPATYEAMAPYIVTAASLATTLAVDIVCEDITDPAELEKINAG